MEEISYLLIKWIDLGKTDKQQQSDMIGRSVKCILNLSIAGSIHFPGRSTSSIQTYYR